MVFDYDYEIVWRDFAPCQEWGVTKSSREPLVVFWLDVPVFTTDAAVAIHNFWHNRSVTKWPLFYEWRLCLLQRIDIFIGFKF